MLWPWLALAVPRPEVALGAQHLGIRCKHGGRLPAGAQPSETISGCQMAPVAAVPGDVDYCRAPTALAMTSNEVSKAAVACIPIRTFARLVRGIVSVGLNALLLVVERYR